MGFCVYVFGMLKHTSESKLILTNEKNVRSITNLVRPVHRVRPDRHIHLEWYRMYRAYLQTKEQHK